MEESKHVQRHNKKLRRTRNISRRSRFKLNMCRQREAIRSNGLPRIWESHRSQRHLSREYLTTRQLCRRKRQARLIVLPPIAQPTGAEINRGTMPPPHVQTPTHLGPAHLLILTTFRRLQDPALQTRATQSWTRSTSSSRKRYSRSRNKSDRNFSKSRIRSTSG